MSPLVLAGVVLIGCAADGSSTLQLSPAGKAGREVARTKGCAACHGLNGQGGTGPALTGLYGSTVTFADGTSAVADDAYLTESIRDPNAKIVPGYSISMPAADLDDAEVASLLVYMRELSSQGTQRP